MEEQDDQQSQKVKPGAVDREWREVQRLIDAVVHEHDHPSASAAIEEKIDAPVRPDRPGEGRPS